ncbi:MAG: hypothetical protein EUB_01657 [Eubacterium sp.]|uniref:InlB B-repeat-containing protein n=1 Tax=Eubacterium sp. TaxID=142586 RepID=UPI00306C0A05
MKLKRTLAIMMAAVLCTTALPVSVFAEDTAHIESALVDEEMPSENQRNGENAIEQTEEERQADLKCIEAMPWSGDLQLTTAQAADSQLIDDEITVKSRLESIQHSTYPDGSKFEEEGFYGATTCFGFAKKIQYLLFGNIVSWNYDGSANSGLITIGSVSPNYTADNVASLLSQAQVGDLLQLENGNGYSQHSMIFGGRTADGFIIYDANWDRANTVFIREVGYGTFSGRQNPKLSLLRNTNYPKKAVNDVKAPTVSDVVISDVSPYAYQVYCNVSDDVAVKSVRVAVWTEKNGQDDLKWVDAAINGNTASAIIYLGDHNYEEGIYHTHIYAYDYSGKQTGVAASDTVIDYTAPELAETQFVKKNHSRFVIGGKVEDMISGVDCIEIRTVWPGGEVTEKAALTGNNWEYAFNFTDHQAGSGYYYIYITAYDKAGNSSYSWSPALSEYFDVRLVQYTVTFDTKGGNTITSALVQEDMFLKKPEAPQREGYIFKGWYQDKACTKIWNFDKDRVEENNTLYAAWAEKGMLGDVYEDGSINSSDALLCLRHSIKEVSLKGNQFKQADVTFDDKVNASDALQILRYAVKEINRFD